MVRIPNTYSEWIKCLDNLRKSTMDEEVIDAMNKGDFSWQAGVAERFTNELFKVIQERTKFINDMLKNLLANSSGNEFEIANALINGRKAIETLLKLSKIEAFPEDLRKTIEETLKNYADSIQNSLVDSIKADRTGKLRVIVNNNPINRFGEVRCNLDKNINNNTVGLGKPAARRIIIN